MRIQKSHCKDNSPARLAYAPSVGCVEALCAGGIRFIDPFLRRSLTGRFNQDLQVAQQSNQLAGLPA